MSQIFITFSEYLKFKKSQLKQLPDGRYYKPGRSCGILNSIKLLPNIPEKVDEIEGCTIIDLSLASPSTIPESGKVVYYVYLCFGNLNQM